MTVPRISIIGLFLLGCKSSTNSSQAESFHSMTSELFFKADIRNNYESLITYFETIKDLKATEMGWTMHPPLSAKVHELPQRTYKFQKYLDVSPVLKEGWLLITKRDLSRDASAVIEISLYFKEKKDAESFYKKLTNEFRDFPLVEKKFVVPHDWSTAFHDKATHFALVISMESSEDSAFHFVTIRIVPEDRA